MSFDGQGAVETALIHFLASGPGFDGFQFDPAPVLRTASLLSRLGSGPASAVVDGALRSLPGLGGRASANLLIVARTAFVPRDAALHPPELPLGQPDTGPPARGEDFPLFPLSLEGDIPFLVVGGYVLGGQAVPPRIYLDWCREHCQVRELLPSSDPLAGADALIASERWADLEHQPRHDWMLRAQAVRALGDVMPMDPDDLDRLQGDVPPDSVWEALKSRLRSSPVVWDRQAGAYRAA